MLKASSFYDIGGPMIVGLVVAVIVLVIGAALAFSSSSGVARVMGGWLLIGLAIGYWVFSFIIIHKRQ
jgi:hypothetical protein